MEGKPRLALSGIGRRFGEVVAVQDVTLALKPGEFVSLLGPSGCGKTTTLRMIAGFIRPSEGVIEMDGELLSSPTTTRPPERRNMSMIFQSYAIWPHMTVAENVAFGLSLRRLPSATVREKVDRMLDVVKLKALADRYPAALSGGQQQRVALARAMVVEPGVLLLDEPLSNLDAGLRETMRFEIRRLHDEFRITTVYVTHDQAEAMVTSDRIAVMNQGRVEQVDTPHAIYNRPQTRFVAGFIGRTNFLEGTLGWRDHPLRRLRRERRAVSRAVERNGQGGAVGAAAEHRALPHRARGRGLDDRGNDRPACLSRRVLGLSRDAGRGRGVLARVGGADERLRGRRARLDGH